MSIKEYDDSQYTKEKDTVEKYLLRIIQRYFDIENNYTKESVEAIIVESLTRLKQFLIKDRGFMFSLNQKTGHLVLTIKDFGGEYAFDKNSAFNKDFGTDGDTICEGNDIRLENAREPLEHSHQIADVRNLETRLYTSLGDVHVHNNRKVLDILTYTGNKALIDLTILDTIQDAIDDTAKLLHSYGDDLNTYQKQFLELLDNYKPILQDKLVFAQAVVKDCITWLDQAKRYTNGEVEIFKAETMRKLLAYISNQDSQNLKSFFDKATTHKKSGDIPITKSNVEYVNIPDGTSLNEKFTKMLVTGIDNSRIKLTFRYDVDGETIEVPLPYHYSTDDGKFGIIQGGYSQYGDIVVNSIFCTYLPATVNSSNVYNDTIIGLNKDRKLYYDMVDFLSKKFVHLCLIDSAAKNDFIKQNILDNGEYFIQGSKYDIQDYPVDDNDNEMIFTDWDNNEPVYNDIVSVFYMNSNHKWAVVPHRYSDTYGAIFEYKMKYFNDYFTNPRIHYEVI